MSFYNIWYVFMFGVNKKAYANKDDEKLFKEYVDEIKLMLPQNKDVQKFLFGASKNIAAALVFKSIGIDNLFYGALIGSAGDIFYDKFKKNLEQVNFNQLISYSAFLEGNSITSLS